MHRSDYETLANTIRLLAIRPSIKLRMVEAIADEFDKAYSNFNRHKFIKVAMGMTNE